MGESRGEETLFLNDCVTLKMFMLQYFVGEKTDMS